MEIFLKKKLKHGILLRKKQQTTTTKDPQLTTITAIQSKTGPKLTEMLNENLSCSSQSDDEHKKTIKGDGKRRNILPKAFGSIISSACGSRRHAREVSMCTSDEAKECMEKMEAMIIGKREISPKKALLRNETKEVIVDGKDRKKSSLSKMFGKSSGFSFRRWKTIKIGIGGAANGTDSNGIIANSGYGRIGRLKLRQHREAKEEGNRELELCKKRILMGEKCRPLNPSGLHYGKDGILLPEDVLPIEESITAI